MPIPLTASADRRRSRRLKLRGGLDLGGTKIEAALFSDGYERLATRRIDTPRDSYDDLLAAIADQVAWLRGKTFASLPIGLGCPGFFNDETGLFHAANLPASGKPLKRDLAALVGRLSVGQDLKCFALSEANGGAGEGFSHVFGLILGTGLGGAFCVDGSLQTGFQGLTGEIGHMPVGAPLATEYGLPLRRCGCGLTGCLETLAAGPGLTALYGHVAGEGLPPGEIVRREAGGDRAAARVMEIWLALLSQALLGIQLALDPDCVVLGGGLSKIPRIDARLAGAFAARRLPGSRTPEIRPARFGDASGTRGAAMLA